jgi:hypothetical protein
MGLILFGAILVLFYVAKIFFPEFIVGVAEIPSIVEFGNFVDSNLWAFLIFHASISFLTGYIYCCACCRCKTLSIIETIIVLGFILFGLLLQYIAPKIYSFYNYFVFIIAPFVILAIRKGIKKKTFISTIICFTVDIGTQFLSLFIRDITVLTTCVNSATITILLIDLIIWRLLLYCFYNYQKKES